LGFKVHDWRFKVAVEGFGLRVEELESQVSDSELMVEGEGFGVWDLRLRV
jgi:hypothetical protein